MTGPIATIREALEWYAKPGTYTERVGYPVLGFTMPAHKALAALEQVEKMLAQGRGESA